MARMEKPCNQRLCGSKNYPGGFPPLVRMASLLFHPSSALWPPRGESCSLSALGGRARPCLQPGSGAQWSRGNPFDLRRIPPLWATVSHPHSKEVEPWPQTSFSSLTFRNGLTPWPCCPHLPRDSPSHQRAEKLAPADERFRAPETSNSADLK